MDHLLYGVAYYDEYMPVDRLAEDIAMMQKAGINTVRIAESTWATCEPRDGEFDFSHVERVMDAMERAGIQVIIGTPTYAIPPWLVKKYPDVLAVTKICRGIYGPRQIMDITHPGYLFHAERVIRKLMEVTAHRKCVIGFQLDNETKPYGTAGENAQKQFVQYPTGKIFPMSGARLTAAWAVNSKPSSAPWSQNSWPGRRISSGNMPGRISSSPTISIWSGGGIPTASSRRWITCRQHALSPLRVSIFIILPRISSPARRLPWAAI